MKKEMQNRSTFIDTIKGIGIVLVVWGHCSGAPFTDQIYRFHIPLFLFLSGMFHKQLPFKSFVWDKTQRLLKPYLFFFVGSVLFNWLIRLFIALYKSLKTDFTFPWAVLLQGVNGAEKLTYNVPLWYLVCLFISSNFYFWVLKIKNQWLQHGVVFGLSVVGYMLFYYRINIGYHIDSALTSLVFYHIGYIVFYKHKVEISTISIRYQLTILTASTVLFLIFDNFAADIDIRTNTVRSPYIVFIGEALLAIIITWIVSKLIDNMLIFRYLGRSTLAILCLHTPVFILADIILTKLTPITPMGVSGSICRLVLTLFICTFMIHIYELMIKQQAPKALKSEI
jgi:fucose 4-O-acetylase-like acetyltransferase